MSRITADSLLIACAAIWGFSFLFQKSAMAHVEPMTFVAARCFVAAVVLSPFAWLEGRARLNDAAIRSGKWPAGLIKWSLFAGLAFAAAAVLQQSGLVTASVTNAGFLTALYVVATPFVSYVMTGRALTLPVWGAALLSFAGTLLISAGSLSPAALAGFHAGDLLVALSAMSWAIHVVLVAFGAHLGRPVLFTALQFAVAGVVALVGALMSETISFDGLSAAAVDIAYVGILSGALTFTVFTLALRSASPTEAVIILSSEMLFAALGAWLVRGEVLSGAGYLGSAGILTAILIVQLSRIRR